MGTGKSPAGKAASKANNSAKAQTKSNGLYDNVYVEGDAGPYQSRADEIVQGVRDVLNDFGLNNELRGVYISDKTNKRGAVAAAAMNGQGDLTIVKSYIADDSVGKNPSTYVVSDTFYGTGAHEAGHLVVDQLTRKYLMPNASRLEQATARRLYKTEKEVLREAQRRYGSNPVISKYGSKTYGEKVAEAVSDVYANGNNANAYSRVIVDVLKDIKKGKFKPKITVTKAQMGI